MNTTGTWYYPPSAGTGGWMLSNPPFQPMTDPTPRLYADLSPAAQKALDVYMDEDRSVRKGLAAVLRAVADQLDHDWTVFNCIDALYEIASELDPRP